MRCCFLLMLLVFTTNTSSWANKTELYEGTATRDGHLVYKEYHTVKFDKSGKVLSAETEYKDPDGNLLVKLHSDFTLRLSSPDHIQTNLNFNESYGVKTINNEITLFTKKEGQAEKTKKVNVDDHEEIVVGCQGLHYYLIEHLKELKNKNELPVTFLVPGSLGF